MDEGALETGGIPHNWYPHTVLSPMGRFVFAGLANLVILRLDLFFLSNERDRIRRGRNSVLGSRLHFLYGKECYQYKLEPPVYQS